MKSSKRAPPDIDRCCNRPLLPPRPADSGMERPYTVVSAGSSPADALHSVLLLPPLAGTPRRIPRRRPWVDGRRGDLLDGLLWVDRLTRHRGPLHLEAVPAALAASRNRSSSSPPPASSSCTGVWSNQPAYLRYIPADPRVPPYADVIVALHALPGVGLRGVGRVPPPGVTVPARAPPLCSVSSCGLFGHGQAGRTVDIVDVRSVWAQPSFYYN